MKKMNRLPHEQAVPDTDKDPGPEHDGLPAGTDVEGHRYKAPDSLQPGMPGTGGDFRRPSGGGEIDGDDDVEGHAMGHTRGERFVPGTGTGGDAAPTDDDVEGHRAS